VSMVPFRIGSQPSYYGIVLYNRTPLRIARTALVATG
jgi:hypothetical protein